MKMAIFLGQRSEIKFYFYSKSPILDVGGFAKTRYRNFSLPIDLKKNLTFS
jgi:hypothetical protein